MEKGDVPLLEQMIKSLEEANDILNESYNKNDSQKFNKAKKIILQIQDKISEILKQ
jgi:hypothetical protein